MSLFPDYPDCRKGLETIDALLAISINEENGDEVAHYIARLANIQGYSCRLQAACEFYKLTLKTPESKAFYTLAERQNSSIGKTIMAFQVILSRIKAERQLAKNGS